MAVDLLHLLCLDAKHTKSPFGNKFRQISLVKTYNNSGDFVFHVLLQHFARREPNSLIILINLTHDYTNYSIASAKCGCNLRRKDRGGNIVIIDVMQKFTENIKRGFVDNYCDLVLNQVIHHLEMYGHDQNVLKTTIVMLDDISVLEALGHGCSDIYRLIDKLSSRLRSASNHLAGDQLNYLIAQTSNDSMLTYLKSFSDVCVCLRPLETGHSVRVDGTMMISDNRIPNKCPQQQRNMLTLLSNQPCDIGTTKTYFYKLNDRRARLTTSVSIL